MPSITPDSISGILVAIYLILVAFLGIFSLVTISIFLKNAEKRSVATSLSTVYAILFLLVVIFSVYTLANL